ncbi:MAG: hypothetical protein JO053_02805 [Acidobacteria bacterium]|nr:hypothetical protein [Acidobacteriota bacterium]
MLDRVKAATLIVAFLLTGLAARPLAVEPEAGTNTDIPSGADPSLIRTVKGTSTTFPIHGPFSTSGGFKLTPRHPEKPLFEVEDQPVLIGNRGVRPAPSPAVVKNDPGDSTISAGDIPKVFLGFDLSSTDLETRDLQIAASHTHVVITSYHKITFWTRDGTLLSDQNTVDFFKPAKDDINKVLKDPADSTKLVSASFPINEFYDNRVIFDTYRNRFWVVSLTRNMGPGSADAAHRVTVSSIAISKTENPQDGWYQYWMAPCRDYQAIGVSKKLFVIGYSSGSNFPEYGFLSAMDPAALANGSSGQKATVLGGFKNPNGSAANAYMQPALQYGNSYKDLQFFVSNPSDGSTNIVWALDPANLTQLLQVSVPVAASTPPKTAQQASNADIPHPQMIYPVWGGNGLPVRGPDLVMKAIFRNNKLYWVWDDSIPGDARQIRFIRLNRVDVSAFPANLLLPQVTGSIDRRFGKRNAADPPNDIFSYYMPALAVNKDGTMLITYSRTGATIWPEARYSVYFEKDPDIRPSQLIRKGEYPVGVEDPASGQPVDNRPAAGIFDYNGAAVDPLDDRSVWTINVYGTKQSSGKGQYSLVVKRIPFNSAP